MNSKLPEDQNFQIRVLIAQDTKHDKTLHMVAFPFRRWMGFEVTIGTHTATFTDLSAAIKYYEMPTLTQEHCSSAANKLKISNIPPSRVLDLQTPEIRIKGEKELEAAIDHLIDCIMKSISEGAREIKEKIQDKK